MKSELMVSPIIRPATADDVSRIAVLCGQLGYPTTEEAVSSRLDRILKEERHRAYVAQIPDGPVIGWVEVVARPMLTLDYSAEVEGLVVDETFRSKGVGRRLMEQAEQWARDQGCREVRLRTNLVREKAHCFYERIGYDKLKTSLTYRKAL